MTVVERPNTPVCGTGFRGSNPVSHPYIFSSLLRESAWFGRTVAVQREDALLGTYAQKTLAGFFHWKLLFTSWVRRTRQLIIRVIMVAERCW